eukprot:scaffold25066_cov57-Phaeocystis_antarctica.AAC.3
MAMPIMRSRPVERVLTCSGGHWDSASGEGLDLVGLVTQHGVGRLQQREEDLVGVRVRVRVRVRLRLRLRLRKWEEDLHGDEPQDGRVRVRVRALASLTLSPTGFTLP